VSAGLRHAAEVFAPGTRVLLVVNSAAAQLAEIARAFEAVSAAGPQHLSVITPASLKPWFIHRGVAARAILVPRVAGLEVEFQDFLQRPVAVRWAIERRAAITIGSEPYPPRNEEVKAAFERAVSPMIGDGRYAVHSLPVEDLFLLSAADLWHRAGRADAVAQHQGRVNAALDRLHEEWRAQGRPAEGHGLSLASHWPAMPVTGGEPESVAAARHYAFEQLVAAMRLPYTAPGMPRVMVDPPGAVPAGGWLPSQIAPVRRPAQLSTHVRFHGTKLVVRGQAEGPYAYLVMSRPVVLQPGDAVMAEGRVYRGGITVGLVKGDGWASRVDVDEPGSFLAAAVATEAGPHSLVVANCLKGDDQRTAVVLRRFGWARAR